VNQISRNEAIEMLAEIDRRKAAKDPIFFIENYLMTFDPRPEAPEHDLDFTLYPFQKNSMVPELVKAIKNGYDLFEEKSRDMGATWVLLAVYLWFWLFQKGFQALIGSRKQDYVDDGTMDSLFPKLEYMLWHIKDLQLLPAGFSFKDDRTFMKLINPMNKNAIIGESANPNFGRSGRYQLFLWMKSVFGQMRSAVGRARPNLRPVESRSPRRQTNRVSRKG